MSNQEIDALLQRINLIGQTEVLDIAEHIHRVVGFLTVREGMALFNLAAYGPGKGKIVEIGSFQGKSTIWLARGTMSTNRFPVVAIDPHTGSPEHQPGAVCAQMMPSGGSTLEAFRGNIKRFDVASFVEERVMTSLEAARLWDDSPIRLLFIDGAHEYEAVESDFLSWKDKVSPGGIIAFHDVVDGAEGPDQVVKKYIISNPQFRALSLVNSLLIAQKLA